MVSYCGLLVISWDLKRFIGDLMEIPVGNCLHTYGKIHHFIAGKTHYVYGHIQ